MLVALLIVYAGWPIETEFAMLILDGLFRLFVVVCVWLG